MKKGGSEAVDILSLQQQKEHEKQACNWKHFQDSHISGNNNATYIFWDTLKVSNNLTIKV